MNLAIKVALLFAVLALTGCGAIIRNEAAKTEARAEERYPPIGQFVEVEGVRVHYVIEGSGPDVVLIHGASGNVRDFTFEFVDRIKDRYRVIVMDRPGMGWTDRLPGFGGPFATEAETVAQQARLLQQAAAKLGAERPIVVGHSFGGTVALAWALERPDNIAALVPLSAPSNPWEGGLGVFYDIPSSSLGGGLVVPVVTALANEERLDIAANVVFYPQEAPEGYADYVGAGLAARRETLRANARQVSQLKPQIIAMTQLYDRIDVPTEILHGTADETVPIDIHSDILLTQIPGARLMRLAGIGHMPHHVAADEVEAAIDRAASRARLR